MHGSNREVDMACMDDGAGLPIFLTHVLLKKIIYINRMLLVSIRDSGFYKYVYVCVTSIYYRTCIVHIIYTYICGSYIDSLCIPIAPCLYNQFVCSNGNCVPMDYQCDRYNDCGDNSDEVGCGKLSDTCIIINSLGHVHTHHMRMQQFSAVRIRESESCFSLLHKQSNYIYCDQ